MMLRWALNPHDWPQTDLVFVIFRSQSPQGPWEEVGFVEEGVWVYTDFAIYSPAVLRNFYYIVRCASRAGKGYVDSTWVNAQPEQDNVATEMIRKKMVFLYTRGGSQAAVLCAKTWGSACSRCYNYEKMQATDPDCPNCFGTGYTGGYVKPVYVPAIINPPRKSVVAAGLVYSPRNIYAEIGYMPLTNEGDLFVDVKQNVRYTVKEVQPYSHRLVTVSQTLVLNRLEENDNVYSIPVPEVNPNSYAGRAWDLVQPRKKEWMLRNVSDYDLERHSP